MASVCTSGLSGLLVLAYAIAWAVGLCPDALKRLRSPRVLIVVLSFAVLGMFIGGSESRLTLAGLRVSGEGLVAGASMAMRALTLLVATGTFSGTTSIGGLSALFERLGFGQLGFLLGVAVNLLPVVQSTTGNVLLAVRLRGGFRRNRVRALTRAAVTILVSSLRRSEDIVCAAEARGFTGEPRRAASVPSSATDRWVFLSAIVLGGFLVLLRALGG